MWEIDIESHGVQIVIKETVDGTTKVNTRRHPCTTDEEWDRATTSTHWELQR